MTITGSVYIMWMESRMTKNNNSEFLSVNAILNIFMAL